jgi:hypothetical protein
VGQYDYQVKLSGFFEINRSIWLVTGKFEWQEKYGAFSYSTSQKTE